MREAGAAMINKMARVVWAIMAQREDLSSPRCALNATAVSNGPDLRADDPSRTHRIHRQRASNPRYLPPLAGLDRTYGGCLSEIRFELRLFS